jgi:hypothetical protein
MVESKLEGDLELLPNQQEDWEAIRQDLEAAIEPHKLDQVLRNLDISVERLEWRSQTLSDRGSTTAIEKKSPSVSIAKARELTLAACDKAFNVLVDHQQHWLHQVALQYYVATSGGKFPLRFSWVRKKLDVTIDQNDRLNEVLQEHDKKLEESAVEFVQRFETLREEAEREFYDVLTLKQKNLLASYIGLPRSSSK